MRQVWRWLRSSWGVATTVGAFLGLLELLTGNWGIAGDLFAALEHPAPQVLRLAALVLIPGFGLGALIGVVGILWVVTRRVVLTVDTMTRNDRWARRAFMASASEIQFCLDVLDRGAGILLDEPIDADMRLRLWLLTNHLDTLGIRDISSDYRSGRGWVDRLAQLHLCAVRGDLVLARQLAEAWSKER